MKKTRSLMLAIAVIMIVQLVLPMTASAATGDFTPNPKTAYATIFITKCGGQQYLINAIEKLLENEQKTLDTITSSADFSNITSLGLAGKGLTGNIPPAIGELTNLEYLYLSNNSLSGAIPAELYKLPKLKYIDLSGVGYSGAIPSEFGTMTSLTSLVLKNNKYTGTIPATILANTKITALDLSGNQLTGGVPTDIKKMTALQNLNLSNNALGGTIPDLSALTALKSLSLYSCGLTGTIPDSLYTIKTLQVLDLSSNALTGEISASLSALTNLQHLSLSSNKLRETIPDGFGSKVETVFLENNYLRGPVPATLKARYDTGCKVHLENNYMTGTNLAGMTNNISNFADGATTAQYQLAATQSLVQISKTGTVNVYALLKNSGSGTKIMLNPDEYSLTYNAAKVEATVSATGISVKALTDIKTTDNLKMTIIIKDNSGSAYSKVDIQLTTEPVAISGGGSGNPPTPAPETHDTYINGFPDGTFKPEDSVTREQVSKMALVSLKIDSTGHTTASYVDAANGRWSFPYIEEATELGYMNGYGNGIFKPENNMTRAELATFMVRIAEKFGTIIKDSSASFSDVEDGSWYAEYVKKASAMGLIKGYPDGTFKPDSTVTRAEAVTMMNRMLGRYPENEAVVKTLTNPFADVAGEHWAYLQILEASVTHTH